MLIILLAKTKPPTAQDTVEAFCDAILKDDKNTYNSLATFVDVPTEVREAINAMSEKHDEIAMSWDTKILKSWDDSEASYELVEVPLLTSERSLKFKCQFVVNQWAITSIELSSPKRSLV